MVNYNNGKIYKLTNNKDSLIYVGSTCNSLAFRLKGHISSSKTKTTQYVYCHLNEIGWDNVKIELIINHSCENRTELLQQERIKYNNAIQKHRRKTNIIEGIQPKTRSNCHEKGIRSTTRKQSQTY